MHGQFVLVQLENPNEGVLGRITSVRSRGRIYSEAGEEFRMRALGEDRPVPEDLRISYLKYRVDIRVLGVLRHSGKELIFARLAPASPPCREPGRVRVSDDVLRWVSATGATAQ